MYTYDDEINIKEEIEFVINIYIYRYTYVLVHLCFI